MIVPERGEQAAARTGELWCITRKFPPGRGGMEVLSHELTTRIARRRRTRVVAASPGAMGLPGFLFASACRLLLGCARGSVAAVHLGDPVLAPLSLIARAFRVPVAVTIHGLDVTYAHPLYRLWLRAFLRGIDACVCISEAARRAAIDRGVAPGRASVIGIGIDAAAVPASSTVREDDLVLFVGRLVRRKGLAWFVADVLPALASVRPRLRVVVLGDGPERGNVVEAAKRAGVLDRIELLGALPDAQKWDWLARASLCILPNIPVDSDIEGFGIVALEAMAAGCPLLAADIEGLSEAVAGSDGARLLPAQDAPAWRAASGELLADRDLRDRLGAGGRRWVAKARGWDPVIERYDALFADLIARRTR